MMEIAQLLADGFAIAIQPLNVGLVALEDAVGLDIVSGEPRLIDSFRKWKGAPA